MGTVNLSEREARFVDAYIGEAAGNGTEAARLAGYKGSASVLKVQASRLLTRANVQAALAERRKAQIASADLSAARVLEELRRLAFSDIGVLFDDAGNLRPLHQLTPEQRACIAGVEVVIKNAKAGDGQTDTVHKIKVWDKPRSLEMLAKHFALLTEVVRVEDEQGRIATLLAGRKRAAEARASAR